MKKLKSSPSRAGSDEDLRLKTLLADLLVKFVNLPASRVDEEIRDAQRRICDLMDLDVAVLWQRSGDPFIATHYNSAQEGWSWLGS